MNHQGIGRAQLPFHLAHGFHKRQRLDVTDRSANFGDHEIILTGFAQQKQVAFDLIGNVRHHLDSFAEVFTLAFLGDHIIIDTTGGNVVGAGSRYVQEALVVPQV